jgi:aryl-alcohol dehydrogenase-like predicted oxidoreductase
VTVLAEESGLTLVRFALALVLAKSGVACAIIGATSPAQLQERLKAADRSRERQFAGSARR